MQPQHNYTLRAVAVFAIAVFLTGCNSTTKTAEAGTPKKVAAESEYVRTTQLGSWIPRKVKKNSRPMDSQVQDVDPESMNRIYENNRTVLPPEPNGQSPLAAQGR